MGSRLIRRQLVGLLGSVGLAIASAGKTLAQPESRRIPVVYKNVARGAIEYLPGKNTTGNFWSDQVCVSDANPDGIGVGAWVDVAPMSTTDFHERVDCRNTKGAGTRICCPRGVNSYGRWKVRIQTYVIDDGKVINVGPLVIWQG